MTREEIEKQIDKLEEKKWFMELADEVNTKEYVDIGHRLNDLYFQLKEQKNEDNKNNL